MSTTRRRIAIRWGVPLVSLLVAMGGTAAPASAAPERVGLGQNAPNFNDGYARWTYTCTDQGYFKATSARIVMWSNGRNRVKGFHFKFRIVPAGTAPGQPVPYSNWSSNATTSFDQGTVQSKWMNAGAPEAQVWNPEADWDMHIKVKYPRSLRTAYRYDYTRPLIEPTCE